MLLPIQQHTEIFLIFNSLNVAFSFLFLQRGINIFRCCRELCAQALENGDMLMNVRIKENGEEICNF